VKISPIDVSQKKFSTRLRGYDPDEVDAFLDDVRQEMESMLRRIHLMEAELSERERTLGHMRDNERLIQDTLTLAQEASENVRLNAQKEAEIVLTEAGVEGQRVVARAHAKRDEVMSDLRDLRAQRMDYLSSLRGVLERHKTLLQAFEETLQERDADQQDVLVLSERSR
jgi:cell division initiation protein